MKFYRALAVLSLVVAVVCVAQKAKKHAGVSGAFKDARYVYVQAQDGDIMKPGLYPEDRQAISDIEDGVRDWNRYALAISRREANLVFVVRKGRSAAEQNQGGVSAGPRPPGPPTQSRQPGEIPDGGGMGVGMEVGPTDDILQVFSTDPDGKLTGPIWQRAMRDGLEGPSVPLLRQLRAAVDHAYPSQPAPGKP
jgi:hypothetical protein